MTARLPLYAKILLWFFLNLALLAFAFYLLVRAEFRFGMDWLLSTGASERIQAVSDLITAELNENPRAEWSTALKRFDAAYRVKFQVFREDGAQLAGDAIELPAEVRERLAMPNRPPQRPGPPPWGSRMQPPNELPGFERPPGERLPSPRRPTPAPAPARPGLEGSGAEGPPLDLPGEARPEVRPPLPRPDDPFPGLRPEPLPPADEGPAVHPKTMLRTTGPTRYWMLVRTRVSDGERRRPQPATLIAMSTSLQGGGLFFNPKPWLAVGLGAVVFSALLWFPFIRGITRSIGRISEASRRISEGRFDVRVTDQRRDELGQLGETINHMAERLEGLVTGQKRFLGDIAHELCSPLAKLRVALGIIEQRADEQQQRYVLSAAEKAEHMATLVNELLSFSKASLGVAATKLERVAVRDVVQKAVQRESTEGCTIRVETGEDLAVFAEPELLTRAVANLVRNAIRHAGHAGPITVAAVREKDEVCLTVADSGPGVAEAELERIFDPFYRVDASRDRATGGVGLGLAIVKTCVESCRGTVSCRNRVPSGLEVTIRLAVAGRG